ncbi:MAG: glycosyltransferase [Anaerolineales bacterium]|nr:glycosyltransferase [Anaerolineales bacterium]
MSKHFNWDKLMADRKVEDFLASDDLWGAHQDMDTPGRRVWRDYLRARLDQGGELRLLEIGFGAGIDYRGLERDGLLEAPGLDYYGADVTHKFVAHAQQHYTRMKPHLIDGYRLPFPDGFFDVVYMRHVLEHQNHYEALLAEMLRVSRGEVFVIFFIPLAESPVDNIAFDGTWYNNQYSRIRFDQFIGARGFVAEEIARFHFETGYADDQLLVLRRAEKPAPAGPATGALATRSLSIAFGTQHWPAPDQPTEGIGAYVVTVARGFAARGHQVQVVTCAHPGQPTTWTDEGVRVHQIHLPGPNAKDPASVRAYSRAVAQKLATLDAEAPIDVVEFQEWAAEGWAFGPRPGQLLVVRTQTPSWVIRDFEYAEGSPTELQIDELERWALERADLVTAPSRLGARRLSERWSVDSDAALVIPNGINTTRFAPLGEPDTAAAPLVLCVNRYSPLKGAEQFVRAAAQVHGEFPNARFRMLGRDADWQGEPATVFLRRLARSLGLPDERLEIPGPVPREALPAEYAAADICVNPSLYENVSHTALEALACGRPTVMTSGQGNSEYVQDGQDALVVPPADVDALAEAMRTLLADADLRRRLGAAARRTVEATLSSDVVVGQIEAAYRAGLAAQTARMPLPPARLYVAVLTHNALAYTQQCLASLAAHTPVPHHVFILDNASTDDTPAWLSTLAAPHLHVELSALNRGVPGGRNRLLKTILPHLPEDGLVVFLDNDVELQPGWYEPFLDLFKAQPEVGVAGAHGHPFIVLAEDRALLPAPEVGPTPVDVVTGFCFWVRAGAARSIGLFDERLGRFWHEDDDYCVRALAAGWEVYALPGAALIHHEHKSGVAEPGVIAQGGSPENRRYLVHKWRKLGFVDELGSIVRSSGRPAANPPVFEPDAAAEQVVRERIGAMLGRKGPLSSADLERAVGFFQTLLAAPDILGYAEQHVSELTPEFMALLTLNLEQARADGNLPLTAGLEELQAELEILTRGHEPAHVVETEVVIETTLPEASGFGLSTHWETPLLGFSGYCWMARTSLKALDAAGVAVQVTPTISEAKFIQQIGPAERAYWRRVISRAPEPGVYVSFAQPVVPQNDLDVYALQRRNNPGHRAYVGFTMFETDRIPESWVQPLNDMDEVWVPSEFNKRTFTGSGVAADRIFVTPSGLDPEFYKPGLQAPWAIPGKRGFAFLSVFDWTYRKGWDILLNAYLRAFKPGDDVSLVIRAYRGGETQSSIKARIEAHLRAQGRSWATSPHILLLDQHVPAAQLPALYEACDAFVLPSRGEGWGIPFMEAMAMERAVIGPNWGGSLEFMRPEHTYLLPVEEVEVAEEGWNDAGATFFFKGHRWGEPSTEALTQVMRTVAGDPVAARAKGRAARAFIAREFNETRPSRAMLTRLRALTESAPAWRSQKPLAAEAARTGSAQPARSRARTNGRKAENLKILFVNRPNALTTLGGDTTHMLRLKDGLEALGHTVDLACTLTPDPEGYDLINVFNLLLPDITRRQVAALRAATSAPIVLTPFFWDVSESLWGERVMSEALKVVETDEELRAALGGIAGGLLPAGRFTRNGRNRHHVEYHAQQQTILDYVDAVIPISERERALLAQRFPNAPMAFVVPTGVDIAPPASPDAFVEKYGVQDFVLITGRVEPRKNQLMLLLALRDTEVPVVVAGAHVNPDYLALCRRFAPPNTLFTGRLDEELLASARAAARVHALSSWWECAGISSLEAALADCNVVMGDRAAEPEYFGSGAYYCDPANVESVRAAVASAYNLYDAEQGKREQLQNTIRERFNWVTVTAQTVAAYRAVCGARQRPSIAPARRELARALDFGFREDPQGVLDTLGPRLQRGPHTPEVLALVGDALLAGRDVNTALTAFHRAIELQPADGNLYRRVGCTLLAQHKRDEAEPYLLRAVELNPDDGVARYWLAQLWRDQGRWSEAVEVYLDLLNEEPNSPGVLTALGDCYVTAGNVAQARTCYESALRFNPGLAEVAQRLLAISEGGAASKPPAPTEVLQKLLDADDVGEALLAAQKNGWLTPDVLALVRRESETVRADGDADLAEGLEVLAEHIAGMLAVAQA